MAIHVRTDYHWIKTPQELEDKTFDLAYIAALAKKLNLEDIYNQAQRAYNELYNQWDKEGSAMARKQTSINWLGGGNKYFTEPLMPFETKYMWTEKMAELMSTDECARELKKTLSEL